MGVHYSVWLTVLRFCLGKPSQRLADLRALRALHEDIYSAEISGTVA